MFKRIVLLLTVGVILPSVSLRIKNSDLRLAESSNFKATKVAENISVQDYAALLEDEREHYPFSDEFIEKYQQADGGYIEYALSVGHLVNKDAHEPNQKWHFFDSWYKRTEFKEGDTAKYRIYTLLQCPELVLWVYEASGVEPAKVKNAFDVAMQGKQQGLSAATIAKNMRAVVSWDDLIRNVK